MFGYKMFVKILQITLVFMYVGIVGLALTENYEKITNSVLVFFPIMIILIELFRGDDLD